MGLKFILKISYWMTLRKGEGTGNCKSKHWIALYGELALEEAMDLSKTDYRMNELERCFRSWL